MSLTAIAWALVFAILLLLSFTRASYALALYLYTFFLLPAAWWWGNDIPDLRWSLTTGILLALAVVLQHLRQGNTPTRAVSVDRRDPDDEDEEPPPRRLHGPILLGAAILANATIVHLASIDTSVSMEHFSLLAKFVVLFVLVSASLRTAQDVRIMLWTVLLCIAYVGYEVTVNGQGSQSGGRLEGVGAAGVQDANELACLVVSLMPLCGCLFFLSGWRGKLVVIPCLALLVNLLILCNSRGAFLAGGIAAMVFLVVAPAAARKQAFAGLVLGVIAVFVLLGDMRVLERFSTTFAEGEERDTSASGRLVFWQAGAMVISDYPFGSGGDAFMIHYSPTYVPLVDPGPISAGYLNRSVHNGYINEAIEWGIQGLALQLALLAWLVLRVRAHLRHQGDPGTALVGAALVSGMAAFLVSSVFGDYLDEEWGYWLAGMMLAYSSSTWALTAAPSSARDAERDGGDRRLLEAQWAAQRARVSS